MGAPLQLLSTMVPTQCEVMFAADVLPRDVQAFDNVLFAVAIHADPRARKLWYGSQTPDATAVVGPIQRFVWAPASPLGILVVP